MRNKVSRESPVPPLQPKALATVARRGHRLHDGPIALEYIRRRGLALVAVSARRRIYVGFVPDLATPS